MSDLLPLVAQVLRDRVLNETEQELRALKTSVSRSVEVIRALPETEEEDSEIVLYASAQFQDGKYGYNPVFWQVNFVEHTGNVDQEPIQRCLLRDLRSIRVCVGGGFPMVSLDNHQPNRPGFEGFLDHDEVDGATTKAASFCFSPNATWFGIVIHGWPRQAWESVVESGAPDPESLIDFLVDNVAVTYPDATVEFKDILLHKRLVFAAIKRLIPPSLLAQARAERNARNDDADIAAYTDLMSHVATTMRNGGNDNGLDEFLVQVNEVMDILTRLGIRALNNDTRDMVGQIITSYNVLGRDNLDAALQRAMDEVERGNVADDDQS